VKYYLKKQSSADGTSTNPYCRINIPPKIEKVEKLEMATTGDA
jgi:hypothetical protein